jgi:dGTPase
MSTPAPLASYACRPEESRGRLHPEPESASRTVFQRDRDRIIHSTAFRRLQYKTQVFVVHEGDHYRTRLTHSLEVAQIARSISRGLGLNEDLAEALALAHDLGHTPFGHAGEDALAAAMERFGGFGHNDQTFRILTRLERRYAGFDGLNLTWETLEGTVKHNGPLTGRAGAKPLPSTIAEYATRHDLELATWPGAEAQVAAMSDDIAYNNHDIDDGLRAGLFAVRDLVEVPLVGPVLREVERLHPGLEEQRLVHEAIRRVIDRMASDLTAESRRRLAEARVRSVADIRALGAPVAGFSEAMTAEAQGLRAFLFERMYRHYRVNRMASKARRIVQELFQLLLAEPQCLPTEWRQHADGPDQRGTARIVADYIAGMTDRFALDEHYRLFDRYATT